VSSGELLTGLVGRTAELAEIAAVCQGPVC